MLHATVEETAAVGICKVAAIGELGVVGHSGACYATGAECAVVSLAGVVIYVALKACLVEFPIACKMLPLWVETVDGIVPVTVVVGWQDYVPHAYLVNASKESAAKQQRVCCRGGEWHRQCSALCVCVVYKQAKGTAVERQGDVRPIAGGQVGIGE